MFAKELSFELKKSMHLKIPFIALSGAVAVSVLSTFSLWSGHVSEGFKVLPAVLLSTGFFSALIWPIVVSVMASRLVGIEYAERGWMFLVTAGCTVRELIWAKGIVGFAALAVSSGVQALLTFVICRLAGVKGSIDGAWVAYFTLLWAVNAVFYFLFVVLASAMSNHIIVLLTGIASAFISVFNFLAPSVFSFITPWGYYAQIVPYRQNENFVEAADQHVFAIVMFFVISTLILLWASRRVRIWR